MEQWLPILEGKIPINDDKYNFENIYIPILRGLRPIAAASQQSPTFADFDNYNYRTVFDYFTPNGEKSNKTYDKSSNIYTGLSLYKDLQEYSHSEPEQRAMVDSFENFLSDTFFEGKQVEIIPRHQKDVVYVRIGQDEKPIYDLGDGIQALIILTYPLFFRQGEILKVFIEEPELHLHPGYQRVFLETLLRPEFEKYQYFITTHSNHLLDMTLDEGNISIYTLKPEQDTKQSHRFVIENVENDNLNVLELLGVRNSSVFLSNCTIWVEGITDRIYIRKYLDIVQADKKEKYKEDTHYSFVEYGGNNITHWSFLDDQDTEHPNIGVDKLCGKLFLITDKDKSTFEKGATVNEDASKKAKRHQQLERKLGERYYCLDSREIENLLIPNIIKEVILQRESNNNKVPDFSNLKMETYQHQPLGKFIADNIPGLTRKYNDSGTIAYKDKFAKAAVSFIKNKSDMSDEAVGLAEKLYAFIKSNNN